MTSHVGIGGNTAVAPPSTRSKSSALSPPASSSLSHTSTRSHNNNHGSHIPHTETVDTLSLASSSSGQNAERHGGFLNDRRNAIAAETVSPEMVNEWKASSSSSSKKTEDERERLHNVMRCEELDVLFVHLSSSQREAIIDAFNKITVKKETALCHQGDEANDFYFVDSGILDVLKSKNSQSPHFVNHIMPGEWYGETALLHPIKQTAMIKASEDSTVWVLNRATFQTMLVATEMAEKEEVLECLSRVEEFQTLTEDEMRQLRDLAKREDFASGTRPFQLDAQERSDEIFVVMKGVLELRLDDRNEEDTSSPSVCLCQLFCGRIFSVDSLLSEGLLLSGKLSNVYEEIDESKFDYNDGELIATRSCSSPDHEHKDRFSLSRSKGEILATLPHRMSSISLQSTSACTSRASSYFNYRRQSGTLTDEEHSIATINTHGSGDDIAWNVTHMPKLAIRTTENKGATLLSIDIPTFNKVIGPFQEKVGSRWHRNVASPDGQCHGE